jgi:hypothetical protein
MSQHVAPQSASRLAIGLAVTLTVGLATPAHADSFFPSDRPAEGTERVSYGGQILASDATGLALLVSAAFLYARSDRAGQVAFGGTVFLWGFGGPIIHALHGQKKRGLASLGLRWGLSFGIGGLIALAVSLDDEGSGPCDQSFDCFDDGIATVTGFVLGGAFAQGLDWTYLAKKDVPVAPADTTLRVMPTRGGMGLALTGRW